MMVRALVFVVTAFFVTAGLAQTPPAQMKPLSPNGFTQGVVLYGTDGKAYNASGGGGGGGATGSVTAAGTNGTAAQAIQGINGGVNVGVSATSWPLPFGAATAANQSTANSSLSSIDAKTPALVGGGQPVTVLNSTASGSQEQDVRSSGTLNAASTSSTIDIPVNGQSTVGLRFSGLAASGATVSYFQSNDNATTFTGVSEVNTATGGTALTRTTDGQVRVAVQGRTTLRLQVTTAGTGTISVAWNISVREGLVSLASPIPPGANTIGSIGNTAFGISGTLPAFATPPTFNLGTLNGAATAAKQPALGVAGTPATDVISVQGVSGGTPQNVAGTVTVGNPYTTTTSGALEPPTAAAGKITRTSTALTANTQATIAAANTNRIAVGLQCASGGVSIDEAGAALTAAGVGSGTLFIPAGTAPYFTPPIATRTAITAYSATAQACVVTEYLR